MSKGYSSEDAEERLQRARKARQPGAEEAEAERALEAARRATKPRPGKGPE